MNTLQYKIIKTTTQYKRYCDRLETLVNSGKTTKAIFYSFSASIANFLKSLSFKIFQSLLIPSYKSIKANNTAIVIVSLLSNVYFLLLQIMFFMLIL